MMVVPKEREFMSVAWSRQPKAESTLRHCTEALEPLSQEDLAYFQTQYELYAGDLVGNIKAAPTSGRYALPIYGPDGAERGMVLRMPWLGAPRTGKQGGPKADTYKSRSGPLQSHYMAIERPEHLVVVEDQLSAIKLAAYGYDSVALLGVPDVYPTGYSGVDRVTEIARRAAGGEVIVALDSDATEIALLFARKWGCMFRRLRVAVLQADIKDTRAADFAEVLGV
jgi:hypothetical protein